MVIQFDEHEIKSLIIFELQNQFKLTCKHKDISVHQDIDTTIIAACGNVHRPEDDSELLQRR